MNTAEEGSLFFKKIGEFFQLLCINRTAAEPEAWAGALCAGVKCRRLLRNGF